MNAIQLELENLRKAAHTARFDPAGKPLARACDLIERMERVLRSLKAVKTKDDLPVIKEMVDDVLTKAG